MAGPTLSSVNERRANQLNPHHIDYWKSRGFSEDDARVCASAGEDVSAQGKGRGGARSSSRARSSSTARGRPATGSSNTKSQGNGGAQGRSDSAQRGRPNTAGSGKQSDIVIGVPATRSFLLSPGVVIGQGPAIYQDRTEIAPIYVSLLVDTSRSMSGAPISNVMDESIKMLKVVQSLNKNAKASVFHFDTDARRVVHNKRIADIKHDRLKEDAEKAAASGGWTALYEAISMGMENMKSYHQVNKIPDMHYFLTVFTDGMDNKSQPGAMEAVTNSIRSPGLPNFHCFIISAGLDAAGRCIIDNLLKGKDLQPLRNCAHVAAGSTSAKDVEEVFSRFTKKIQETMTLTMNITASRRPGQAPIIPQLLAQTRGSNILSIAGSDTRGRSSSRARGRSSSRTR